MINLTNVLMWLGTPTVGVVPYLQNAWGFAVSEDATEEQWNAAHAVLRILKRKHCVGLFLEVVDLSPRIVSGRLVDVEGWKWWWVACRTCDSH